MGTTLVDLLVVNVLILLGLLTLIPLALFQAQSSPLPERQRAVVFGMGMISDWLPQVGLT